MANVKAMVRPHLRRKDGTYQVKIRITHHRQVRWIATNITATDADLTRSLKFRQGTVAMKAGQLVTEIQRCLSDLSPFESDAMDADAVVAWIRRQMGGQSFQLDIFDHLEDYLARSRRSEGTKAMYRVAFNALERYLGARRLDVNSITAAMLRGFAEFMDAEPVQRRTPSGKLVSLGARKRPGTSASSHLAKIATVFRDARERYNDEDTGKIVIPRDPFSRVRVQKSIPDGQKALPAEVMQQVIDAAQEGDLPQVTQTALDVFVLSFALMGANVADLFEMQPPAPDGWMVYNRRKTRERRADHAEIRVLVPPEVSAIVGRLKDGTGQRWLRLHLHFRAAPLVSLSVNRELGRWAKAHGLQPFTMYAARKTWATLARKVLTDKATIDEALGHVGDFRIADIYAERDWSQPAEANRRVLALFRW